MIQCFKMKCLRKRLDKPVLRAQPQIREKEWPQIYGLIIG